MRLLSFQIRNYCSIVDTGIVNLSLNDNVTVFAGQNEAGKSALLKALYDFERKEFANDSLPFSTENIPIQSVSCKYKVEETDTLHNRLEAYITEEYNLKLSDKESFLDKNTINKIAEFTITRTKENNIIITTIDHNTFVLFCSAILEKATPILEGQEDIKQEKYLNISEEDNKKVAEIFCGISPYIVFFEDFCDLLPDKIFISALEKKVTNTEGYRAVKNLEKILNTDFISKKDETDSVRRTKENKDNEYLSIDFQKDWGQRIHGENKVLIKYDFEKRIGAENLGSYINFEIETKEGQPLPPKQRSKGLIWFLSLWLELKAQDIKYKNLILLLDEPDQHLHVKAQKDILGLINKLSSDKKEKKGKQIIYATHSPYLIEVDFLSRVKLVINTEKDGTIIEDITTSKIDTENKKDALQPIANAIGLNISEFSTLKEKNVILEGISDFYYFSGMKKLLNRKGDYYFVPGIGIRQIKNLISFSIGYGLDWIAVVDDDPSLGGIDTKRNFDEIKDSIFDGDENKTKERVYILNSIIGIENMFTHQDLQLIDLNVKDNKDKTKEVGKNRKVLFSKLFFEKVNSGEIIKDKLSKKTMDNFEKVFEFIEDYYV